MAEQTTLQLLVQLRDEASAGLKKFSAGIGDAQTASKNFALGLAGIGAGIVAFGALSVKEAAESAKGLQQLEAVLKSTGQAAGLSKQDILDHAAALSKLTNYDDDAIIAGQNLLLTFTNIKGPQMQGATEAILNMSAAMGTDLKSSAIQVGKALNDPIAGISALSRVGVTFSEDQKKVIETLVTTGKTAEAQQLILAELSREFGGVANAQLDPIIKLKQAFSDAAKAIGFELLPYVQTAAAALVDFVNNGVVPAIEAVKNLVNWFREHQLVLALVVGGVVGALIPAFIAFAVTLITVTIPAIAAAVLALAPFMLGGMAVVGIAAGVMWIIRHWDLVKEKAANVWNWIKEHILFVAAILGPVGAVAIGIAAGVNWIIQNWDMLSAKATEIFTAIADFFKGIWEKITGIFDGAINGIVSKFNGLMSMIDSVKSAAASVGSFASNAVSSIGNAISGKRAAGGPVGMGQTYLVGERGPELFTPGLSGNITPNSSLGGANITVNITGNTISSKLDIKNLANEVGNALMGQLRLNARV